MNTPYNVYDFNIDALKTVLFGTKHRSARPEKQHVDFLHGYLVYKKAATIVVENSYIERSYLEDYSEYYVRCFNEYGRHCTRIHFFKRLSGAGSFKDSDLCKLLSGENSGITVKKLQDAYIGFIVIKPLPDTIIGRTCLEAYEHDGEDGKRYYPVTRNYPVTLFGIDLTVKNSLPFQEQDRVVSACATSALWSMLHAISPNPDKVKSPCQITKTATKFNPLNKRSFPVAGLTPEMMGHVISEEGLDAYNTDILSVYKTSSSHGQSLLKEIVYAYLKNKIPIVLGLKVYSVTKETGRVEIEYLGNHAVTVAGYSLSTTNDEAKDHFLADRINKVYVHDDQVGPFARLVGTSEFEITEGGKQIKHCFMHDADTAKHKIYLPDNVFVGLYHKIRIPYMLIREGIISFNVLLRDIRILDTVLAENKITWDIYLSKSNEYKTEILSCASISQDTKHTLLTTAMPKYVWRVTAESKGAALFDLIFDATDIPQGQIFVNMIERNEDVKGLITDMFRLKRPSNVLASLDPKDLPYKIINGIYNLATRDKLTVAFGKCCLPSYIKSFELDADKTILNYSNTLKLENLGDDTFVEDKTFIWLIQQDGELVLAPEEESGQKGLYLGHPCLIGGEYARIAGEVRIDSGEWVINNHSGRYSKSATRNKTHLENVAKLLSEKVPKLSKIKVVVDVAHANHIFKTIEEVIEALKKEDVTGNSPAFENIAASLLNNSSVDVSELIQQLADVDAGYYPNVSWLLFYLLDQNRSLNVDLPVTKIIEEVGKNGFEYDSHLLNFLSLAITHGLSPELKQQAQDVITKMEEQYKEYPQIRAFQ